MNRSQLFPPFLKKFTDAIKGSNNTTEIGLHLIELRAWVEGSSGSARAQRRVKSERVQKIMANLTHLFPAEDGSMQSGNALLKLERLEDKISSHMATKAKRLLPPATHPCLPACLPARLPACLLAWSMT